MLDNPQTLYIILALGSLMSVYIFFPQLERMLGRHWPAWVSASGGLAVGYVFIYLLPKLTMAANDTINRFPEYPLLSITIVYFFMLLGFISYWIIDVYSSDEHPLSSHWRKLQSISFFIYNILIGHLIASATQMTPVTYLLATLVLGLHLAGMSHQYKTWHQDFFSLALRWLMPAGILIGAFVATVSHLPKWVIGPATAYVGGAILINVIYYELPRSRSDRTRSFLIGVLLFTVANLIIRYLRSGAPSFSIPGFSV